MKIGIVTIHHAKYSYGAVLQALAMKKLCQHFSDDVEIINYENEYEQNDRKFNHVSPAQKLVMSANYFARNLIFGAWRNPYRKSENLDKIYECVTTEKYTSAAQMKDLDYDILVCGSDQIWNPQIMGCVDPAFLLDFGHPSRRISYAASMGSYIPSDDERQQFKNLLSKFTAISVREEHAKKELQGLTEKEIAVVADPTLLTTASEWVDEFADELKPETKKERYILTFFVWNGFSAYRDQVVPYMHKLGLPVWNVQSHSRKVSGVDRVIQAPEVGGFLRLLKNADLVITNSFHGVVFSLIFNKAFVPLLNVKNPARVQNLLKRLNLSELIDCSPDHVLDFIQYDEVNNRLATLREESLKWFSDAVEGSDENT